MAGYLNNIADSLIKKSLPTVANSIFSNEHQKSVAFSDKLESATAILHKAKSDVMGTADGLAGPGKLGKKLASQLKSGKFGTTTQEAEDQMFKSMGFDFGEDFDIGDSDTSDTSGSGSTTLNKTTNNTSNTFNMRGPLGSLTEGDALINERLAINNQASINISNRQIGILSHIGQVLANMSDFMNTNVGAHIENSLSHYQLQASMSNRLNEALDPMITYYKNANEEVQRKKSVKELTSGGHNDIAKLIDPEYYAKSMTEGSFSMLFGDMSPIKGMLQGFSNDPLGTLIAAGVGSAISSVFTSQIDRIRGVTDTVEYKLQNILETWSSNEDSSLLGSLKNTIGSQFKMNRDGAASVQLGKYTDGEIGFDGQTKQAIVNVIPMYLAKILRAISGSNHHEVYDYKNGKFIDDTKGRRTLSKNLAKIDRGEFAGGVGNELKFAMLGAGLSKEDQRQLQRQLVSKALDRNSSQSHVSKLDLGDPRANSNLASVLGKLDPKELRELNTSFQGYRFERERHVRTLQNSGEFGALENSAILGGSKRYGLRKETDIAALAKSKKSGEDDTKGPFDEIANELERARKERAAAKGSDKLSLLDRLKDSLGRTTDKFTSAIDTSIFSPLRHALMGKKEHSFDEAKDSTFFDSISKGWNRLIIRPFKTKLLGVDKEAADETSLFKTLKEKFDINVLKPFKTKLIGKERADTSSFFDSIKISFNEKVLDPVKGFLLGKGTSAEDIHKTGFFKSIALGLDRTVFLPVKKLLVGDKKAEGLTLFGALNKSFSKNIVFPLKQALLGSDADAKTVAKTSFIKSLGLRIDHSVLLPIKTALMGGNKNRAENMSIWQTLGNRFDKSIMFPMKKLLMGGEDRTNSEVFRSSFFNAIKTGWSERIMQPLSAMLFGEEKRKDGFFKNLGDTFSPFFNKLLFGADKASKGGLLSNIKTESKLLWANIWGGAKERFFKPLADNVKELFGPVFKDFRNVIGENLRDFGNSVKESISGGIKVGAKGLFKDVFGDETVKLLRDNVVAPLRDLTNKLTDNMSKVFKFLIRIPVNFMKGVTDTLKIQRLNSGKGNYAADEVTRLRNLESKGRVFDFLNLGSNNDNDPKKSGNSLFSRFASALTGKNVSGVTDSGSIKLGRNKQAADANGLDHHAVNRSAGKANSKVSLHDVNSEAKHANKAGRKDPNAIEHNALTDYVSSGERLSNKFNTDSSGAAGRSTKGGMLRSSTSSFTTHAPDVSLSIIANTSRKLDTSLPTLTKGASDSSKMLEFMRRNLTKVDLRLENLVKLMRKGVGADVTNVKGSSKFSLFSNPLHWAADKVSSVFSFASGFVNNAVSSVGKIVNSVVSIPGKIAKSLTNLVTTMAKSVLTVTSSLVDTAAKAISKGLEIAGNLATSLLSGMSRVLSGLMNVTSRIVEGSLKFVGTIVGPLAKGIGTLTTTVFKQLVPIASELVGALGKAVTGIIKLGAAAVNTGLSIATGLANVISKGLGFGGFGKGSKHSKFSKTETSITNYSELAIQSRLNPLHVHVVDGRIGTYEVSKSRRSTMFKDKDESRSLLGGKNDKDKDSKGKGGAIAALTSLLGGLTGIPGLGTLGAASAAAKVLSTGIETVGNRGGNNSHTTVPDASTGKKKPKTPKVPSGKKGLASRAVGGLRGMLSGSAAAEGAATAARAGLGSKVASLGGKLLKGAGIAGAIGFGGNLVADMAFDKGTMGNELIGDTASWASYGALAGSIIPGIGTAAGALIGGLFGAVKVLRKRFVSWFEKKFEDEIRSLTETFIQIPNRITQWADELPNRIAKGLEDLPGKMSEFINGIPKFVSGLFISDAATVDENGNIVEDKPSILGRLFSALGQATWAVVKAVPKIVVGLVEGLGKAMAAAAVSGVTVVAKGIYAGITGMGDLISKMFDTTVVRARNYIPSILGGISDDETAAKLKEIDAKYEKRAAERSSELTSITNVGNSVSNAITQKGGIADLMSSGGTSSINEYKNIYNEVYGQSNGNEAKALELFKERTKNQLDAEASLKEFKLQQGEKANRSKGFTTSPVGTIGVGGYTLNNNAVASAVTAASYSKDPGLFTNQDIDKAITAASSKYGIPVSTLKAIAQMESSNRYWVTNKFGYAGLYQMGREEFAKFSPDPTGSPLDPYLNSMAAANYMAFNSAGLKAAGIPITPANIYLAHQQGLGGISDIYAAAKGTKPLSEARIRNMKHNPPQDGGGVTLDPRMFIERWSNAMAKKTGAAGGTGLSMMASNPNSSSATASSPVTSAATANGNTENMDPEVKALADKFINSSMANIHTMVNGGTGPASVVKANTASTTQVEVQAKTSVNNAPQMALDNARIANAKQAAPIVIEPDNATVAAVEDSTTVIARELSAQTALLTQLVNKSGNFFTGAESKSSTPTVETPKASLNPTVTLNQHKALIQADQGPLMLQPGRGASNVAKAGT